MPEAQPDTLADLSGDVLRELSSVRPEQGRVLSLYLDLDPSEFATADARASAVTSLVGRAGREIESLEGLDHDARQGLREDLSRARELLEGIVPPDQDHADGARALAVFCCGPAGLFRSLRLSHPVTTEFRVAERPWIGPLVEGSSDDWCILLVNRSVARVFLGGRHGLDELGRLEDDVHGQHDQGGWSQARYGRSVEKDAQDHLAHVAEVLRREVAPRPFRHLLIGGPVEIRGEVEEHLGSGLRDRLAGHFRVDVENSDAKAVLEAATPAIEQRERELIDERIDRLREGAAHGTGVMGLGEVLSALNKRAVETLLVQRGFGSAGRECPSCGLLATEGVGECPADGTTLEYRDDILESALGLVVEQSAETVYLPADRDDLGPVGQIGAVLRFAPAPTT